MVIKQRLQCMQTTDRRIIKWIMRVFIHFDQRGEHVKVVCLICIQIMACQYVDHCSSVIEFHIVVNWPEWMHREELIVGCGDIFISHQNRVLAPFLAHSSSFHVSLVYSACVRNRRTTTLRMLSCIAVSS